MFYSKDPTFDIQIDGIIYGRPKSRESVFKGKVIGEIIPHYIEGKSCSRIFSIMTTDVLENKHTPFTPHSPFPERNLNSEFASNVHAIYLDKIFYFRLGHKPFIIK